MNSKTLKTLTAIAGAAGLWLAASALPVAAQAPPDAPVQRPMRLRDGSGLGRGGGGPLGQAPGAGVNRPFRQGRAGAGPGGPAGLGGPGNGMGVRAILGQAIRQRLNLTDEQSAQLQRIQTEGQQEMADLQERVRQTQQNLNALVVPGETPDPAAVRDLADQIGRLTAERVQSQVEHRVSIYGILTAEQLDQVRAWAEQRPGRQGAAAGGGRGAGRGLAAGGGRGRGGRGGAAFGGRPGPSGPGGPGTVGPTGPGGRGRGGRGPGAGGGFGGPPVF